VNDWHADEDLLAAYAGGCLDRARAASVEQHLPRCERCRQAISSYADESVLQTAWHGTIDTLDQPRTRWFERLLTALGLSPSAARLATGASAARRAWVAGCVVVAAFAIVAGTTEGRVTNWFLTIAPLAPLTGVALAYGPGLFGMHEVVVAAPYPRLRLVLLRCLPVLPATLLLLVAGGLALPVMEQSAVWLLPGFALATLGLVLERLVGARVAVAALSGMWVAYVSGTRFVTGSVIAAFTPTVQVLSLCIVLATVAIVARRTVVTGARND
jgi:hypothetical protein